MALRIDSSGSTIYRHHVAGPGMRRRKKTFYLTAGRAPLEQFNAGGCGAGLTEFGSQTS